MKEIAQSLYSKFITIPNTLNASIGGRMYHTQAPQNAVFPYVVFSFVSQVPEYTFDTSFEDVRIQFSIFSLEQSVQEIETIKEALHTLYDWCSLSVTGYAHIYMRRFASRLVRDDRPSWNYSVDYKVFVEKT